MPKILNKKFDEERALYHLTDCEVENCVFQGEADGESALKETRNVTVADCEFHLRYPLWHCHDFAVTDCVFFEPSRAPLWYDKNGSLKKCSVFSVKPLRECDNVTVVDCKISSTEVGWNCRSLKLLNSEISSDYFLMGSSDVFLNNVKMNGKYSFQYLKNVVIENCELNTKDAFWHAQNVTVKNCKVIGEYLGWYSENLTFENCEIFGTQPLCYCKNLVLKNCSMHGCDLAFEYSDVDADVNGEILSVKNPANGRIVADGFGEIILQNSIVENRCKIVVRKK